MEVPVSSYADLTGRADVYAGKEKSAAHSSPWENAHMKMVHTNKNVSPREKSHQNHSPSVGENTDEVLNTCVRCDWKSHCLNMCTKPPPFPPGAPLDLVLRRELLHVGAETPESRQEVVDHHLLRNDW